MKKYNLIILSLTLLLSSCLSMESQMVLKESGAGSLRLNYTVDTKYMGLRADQLSDASALPLPLSREDFENSTALVPGVNLLSFQSKKEGQLLNIQSEIAFQNIQSLSLFLGFPITEEHSSTGHSLQFSFFTDRQIPDQLSQERIDSLFRDKPLSFEIQMPSKVLSSNLGSYKGKVATLSLTVPQYYEKESFIWTIGW